MSVIMSPGFWVFVLLIAGIYTIFAMGLHLQIGIAGIANFGHVAFMAIGSYVMAIAVIQADMAWWAACLLAILAAMFAAVLLGMTALRLRVAYMAISTIAFAEIIRYLSMNMTSVTGGVRGSTAIGGTDTTASFVTGWRAFQNEVRELLEPVFGEVVTPDFAMMVIVWTTALVMLLALQLMIWSPWGRILKAIREDEEATAAMGKNVMVYKLQAMAIGSGMGAVAGILFAFQYSFFSPLDFETLISFYAFIIIIISGIGRNLAIPVGAIIFAVIFAGTRLFSFWPLSEFSSAERAYLRFIIIGVVLILMVMFRPQGIFGKREEMLLE